MKDIKINRLEIENFKCHGHLVLDLEGRNASVYGDNASGKTSIYDALTWLLFGKDSAGNGEKNIEIKPLDANGEVKDHLAVTSVEAVLQVGEETVTLRRTYQEVWTTKRGSSEATYDGNTSEYYVDGVPCKKFAFSEKVQELVDEDTFRMLTSVSYFANGISWQDRRAVLFQVAGVMDDKQILATTEQFSPLVESMGRLSLDDYKKKLLAEKRKFVGAKTEIPARISECQNTIKDIEGLDFAAAKAEAAALQAKKDNISTQITALDSQGGADQKSLEIRAVQVELDALERENKVFRDAQRIGGVDVHSLNMRLTALQMQIERKQNSIENEKGYISALEKRVEESRKRWFDVNVEGFGGGNCPTCGQVLPQAQMRSAMESFEKAKQAQLAEIVNTAESNKTAKEQAQARLSAVLSEVLQMQAECESLRKQIQEAEAAKVEPKDMEDYATRKAALLVQKDKLDADLQEIIENTASVKSKLHQQESVLKEQIQTQMAIISKESLLEYSRQRVAQLREDAKSTAQCLESIEKMLYMMDEYTRYKTRFVEDSINGHFRIARFRLFREQANGGVEDRCDVVHDGVPYISVNNGMKINLGIDIINTLSKAYGVRVPLFVDNAESVTNLEKCSSQIVRLVVSEKDKELRVSYED